MNDIQYVILYLNSCFVEFKVIETWLANPEPRTYFTARVTLCIIFKAVREVLFLGYLLHDCWLLFGALIFDLFDG